MTYEKYCIEKGAIVKNRTKERQNSISRAHPTELQGVVYEK